MEKEQDAFFEVDSRLLFELGEKLVTNRAIALAELIKNAYDADAKLATITLENIREPGGTIIIQDDGIGITEDSFKKGWMRIATMFSEENPISKKYERTKSGKKGIGRFACRKLAKKLILASISEDDNGLKTELNANFDWSMFKSGSDVNKIPCKYSTRTVKKTIPTSTTLRLENTTESWDEKNIKRLKNELSELFSPIIFTEEIQNTEGIPKIDPGFEFEIKSNEFQIDAESLNKDFFKNAWAKLSGSVDAHGMAKYECKIQQRIVNKFERALEREISFEELKCAKFEIFIFSYRTDLFKKSDWTVAKSMEIGRKRGGVKVYADKFRIFGYGDEGNDWLCVDYDRARSRTAVDEELANFYSTELRPGLALFRNAALFGYVTFEQEENPNLEILINRDRLDSEGIVFKELRRFVRLGIDFATVIYASEIAKEFENRNKEIEENLKKFQNEFEERRSIIEKGKRKAEEAIKKAETERIVAEEEEEDARLKRVEAEEKRRIAEEERRAAEVERRIAEENARNKKIKEAILEAERAIHFEEEKIQAEKDALKIEQEKRKEEEYKAKFAEEKRKQAFSVAYSSLDKIKSFEEEILNFKRTELSREADKYREEFSRLRVLASTGTLIFIFSHEIQALVEDMRMMNFHLSKLIDQLSSKEQKRYRKDLEIFKNRIQMIKDFKKFLGLSLGQESRSEIKPWPIKQIIGDVFSPFKLQLTKRGIEFKNTIPYDLQSPAMFRSELVAIFHNLMSNAIKFVTGMPDRRIEVKGTKDDDFVYIRFLDSGKGLEKNLWKVVFEPFISYSEPDLDYGAGTGLGLKIVRDIVRAYDGEVQFIEPPLGWKTCIEIKLPRG